MARQVIPFDWQQMRPGTKLHAALEAGSATLPVLATKGARPGRTLVISAGVHGDEFEGVQAIFDLFEWLDPSQLRGNVIAVPVANPPAFWAIRRTSPLDDANLARVFPGNENGSPTEVIAWHFDRRILALADFYIDLHSAGIKCIMPTLAGYHLKDQQAAGLAEAFGAPVVWGHPSFAPGRTVSAAWARGISSIYVEARGGGRIHPEDLEIYRRGLRNSLAYLGFIEETLELRPARIRLEGDGDIDSSLNAGQRGFLSPTVELLEAVQSGQQLGVLRDEWGRVLESYQAPRAGVVVLIHACPVVEPGEPLFLITERQS